MQAQYLTLVVDHWSELKSHNVETQSCLPTSKTEQIAGCLAPSSSCKFKKKKKKIVLMFGIQMFMRIQKWNLEVELNSAKLKKVKT